MKVSLFVTCLTDLFSPQVGLAVVKTLEHFGCEVDFPSAQTCCGQPAFNNGFPEQSKPLAARMIQVFQDANYVVTPSGSCCAMIRDHYIELFKGDSAMEHKATEFVAKCYEFVEFLTKILKVDLNKLKLKEKTTFTYHYTCHLRGLGATGDPAIRLLKQIGNAGFAPLEKSEQCCGFGGTFAVKYHDISGAMVRDKVDCGKKSGAGVMIVNDTGCAMNIGGAGHRYAAPFKVRHIAEVIAEAIENSREGARK
ncbi:MAG TPA: (Fe-S)-binding protein [Phycisphaerae bacterium]|nr:(Fe-S)-binding protein [Phycisphaerae bacterium]